MDGGRDIGERSPNATNRVCSLAGWTETRQAGGSVRFWCGEPLRAALTALGLDSVRGAFAYAGASDMTKPGLGHRTRWRLTVPCDGGQVVLFMKRYSREPLGWRLRRRVTYGRRRSPAGVEMDNIQAAHAAGLSTIPQAACGEEFDRWGARRSFIIMQAVPGEALEQCAEGFLARHAHRPDVLEAFTGRLAELVGRLHRAGYVHRDLYSSHVFLEIREAGEFCLHLIDLARMFAPRWRRFRWRVKDLAALKHSMPAGWVEGQWDAFLAAYLGAIGDVPRAEPSGSDVPRWRRAVDAKVAYMRWRLARRRRFDRERLAAEQDARGRGEA